MIGRQDAGQSGVADSDGVDAVQVKQDVVEAIGRVPYLGNWTQSQDALRLVYEVEFQRRSGDRAGVPNVAIFVSDGNSNVFPELTPVQACPDSFAVFSYSLPNADFVVTNI